MAIADGSYEILPLLDATMAMDVISNSAANKANVRLWGRNGSNEQKWQIASQGSYFTIRDAETGKSLDVANGTQAKGTNVWMYTYSGSTAQRWTITETGTQAINGTSYPTVTIGAFGASTYVLDCAGGKSTMNTNIQIWTPNGSAAQQFVLFPTEWNAANGVKVTDGGSVLTYYIAPTPTMGDCGTTAGTPLSLTPPVNSGTIRPAWVCDKEQYQVRYRTRTRNSGASTMGAWTNWKSISGGSTAWDGFGAPGQSNCTPTVIDGVCWSTSGVSVNNSSTYDRTDIEFGVRCWIPSWYNNATAHGDTYTFAVVSVRPVTVSEVGVLLTPDGVTVTWVTDATHGGNAITVTSDVWGSYSTTGAATGSVAIPQRLLRSMPNSGDTVKVEFAMKTIDGLVVTTSVDATASYEGTHGTSITISSTVSGTIATVTSNRATTKAWLVVPEGHATRFVPLAGSTPWKVAPPIGVPWSILATYKTSSSWSSKIQTFNAIADAGWHITSQDLTKDLAVYTGEGNAPKADPSYSRSVSSVDVMGRDRPVYLPTDTTEATWTLEGITYGAAMDGDVALADWAVHAGHVYFRSPMGFWSQACVTGGKVEQTRTTMRAISVSMSGEVW